MELTALDVALWQIYTDKPDLEVLDDSFNSIASVDIEAACKIIRHAYVSGKRSIARHLYPGLVAAGDNYAVETAFFTFSDQMEDVDHLAHLNSPGGNTWAKMMKREMRVRPQSRAGKIAKELIDQSK